MALWGVSDSDESKAKYLNGVQKIVLQKQKDGF